MIGLNHIGIILFILPVYQMSYFAVQLITLNNKKDPSRKPLGFLMLLMLIYIIINMTKYLGYTAVYNYFSFFQLPVLLAIIPTYCRYLWVISNAPDRITSKPLLLCFLPALSIFLLNIISFLALSVEQRNLFLSSEMVSPVMLHETGNLIYITFLLGNVVLIAFQIIMASFQFRKIMRQMQISREENVSFLPYFESGWAYLIFLSILIFVMINSVMNYLAPAYNTTPAMIFNLLVLTSGSLAGYFGLKQDRLYNEVSGLRSSIKTENQASSATSNEIIANEQQTKSTFVVSKEESKIIIDKLQHLLVSDKPFLNSKIRVIDVARKLNTSKHKLTYVINHEMGSNFYGVINEQRVLEAKMLLKHPKFKNYNLETIAEMSGFQSKSPFNACFKKITGVTPSTYRKEH